MSGTDYTRPADQRPSDAELRAAMLGSVPSHGPNFWDSLHTRLEGTGQPGRQRGMTTNQDLAGPTPALADLYSAVPTLGSHPRRTRGRWATVALAAAAVAAIVTVGAVALRPSGQQSTVPAPQPTEVVPTADPSPTATPTSAAPSTDSALTTVDGALLQRQLEASGIDVVGDATAEAYRWNDSAGPHAALLSIAVVARTGVWEAEGQIIDAPELHVLVVNNPDESPTLAAELSNPGQAPCGFDLSNDFQPGSTRLSDTDGDGVAEFTIGWASACISDPAPSDATLTVVEGGTTYQVRGTGWTVPTPASFEEFTPPTPDPAPAAWPAGLLDATVEHFLTVFNLPGPTAIAVSDLAARPAVMSAVGDSSIFYAFVWTEDSGDKLLVLAGGAEGDQVFLFGADDALIRTLREPVQTCTSGEYVGGFHGDSVALSDTDGDGIGEVTVGWSFRCGEDPTSEVSKLAMLEGADKYILRGNGFTTTATPVPDPAADQWPAGALQHALEVYDGVLY